VVLLAYEQPPAARVPLIAAMALRDLLRPMGRLLLDYSRCEQLP